MALDDTTVGSTPFCLASCFQRPGAPWAVIVVETVSRYLGDALLGRCSDRP